MDIVIPVWYYFLLVFMSSLSVLACGISVGYLGKLFFVFVKGLLKNDYRGTSN